MGRSEHPPTPVVLPVTTTRDGSPTASIRSKLCCRQPCLGTRMSTCTAPLELALFLEEHCARIRRSRSTVLFRRGEKAFGVFLIFRGKVSLDPEIPQTPLHCYGPGEESNNDAHQSDHRCRKASLDQIRRVHVQTKSKSKNTTPSSASASRNSFGSSNGANWAPNKLRNPKSRKLTHSDDLWRIA